MILKDYYATLGIPVGATPGAIKKAYRHLVMRHHPDKNAGEAAFFREIQEAYDVLSDPLRREDYHQQRSLWKATGKTFEAPAPLTPEEVLRQAIRLYEKVRAMDLYRIDREGITHAIRRLLDDAQRLNNEPKVSAQTAHFLLLAAAPLPQSLAHPLRAALEHLASEDTDIQAEIVVFYKRKRNEQLVARYQTPLLILAALALCYLAYIVSR